MGVGLFKLKRIVLLYSFCESDGARGDRSTVDTEEDVAFNADCWHLELGAQQIKN
jgi:hypothetical protein